MIRSFEFLIVVARGGGPVLAAEVAPAAAWGSFLFGAALAIGGVALLRWHRRSWARQRTDAAATELDLRHFHRQFLRRTQVAGMLVALGVLIPLGVAVIDWQGRPAWWAVFWLGVLLLACWMSLLAVGDMLSQRAHSRVELSRIRRKQRELERQIAELRNREANGRR
ncbi:MAG: hypothetical protein WD069_13195 [Planctomycetales bacterium]